MTSTAAKVTTGHAEVLINAGSVQLTGELSVPEEATELSCLLTAAAAVVIVRGTSMLLEQ